MPVKMPAAGGTPEATAMPRHSGSATRKTTTDADRSCQKVPPRPADGAVGGVVG
jgi:hypothetical protein